VAVIGACTLLAACSPVKMGSAAIVGNDRISASSLDTQVSALSADLAPYRGQLSGVTQAALVHVVLGWMVSFQVQDNLAASEGITTTPAQAQQGLNFFYASLQAQAASQGQQFDKASALPLNGVPHSLSTDFGQFIYQQMAFWKAHNGGSLPATAQEQQAVDTALAQASCQTSKSLNVQVNPQYGQLSGTTTAGLYKIIAGADNLSRPAGVPSPAPTPSFAC
jgi:hypothetical protein